MLPNAYPVSCGIQAIAYYSFQVVPVKRYSHVVMAYIIPNSVGPSIGSPWYYKVRPCILYHSITPDSDNYSVVLPNKCLIYRISIGSIFGGEVVKKVGLLYVTSLSLV